MITSPLFSLFFCVVIDASHFNGGTIRWEPINPYDNSSSVPIAIIQSYSWTYPTIQCAKNVPISTSGRSSLNANLTCVTDCSTDGGYSSNPVNILTDCVSVSSSLNMMTSQRSVNTTLLAGAHFSLVYQGSAWRTLNSPGQSGLYWSILCSIDLRMRDDGFINTPPEANVVSPQYAIVNRTTQIQIPVSDINAGDDVRCRWSVYTPGYRKRRQSDEDLQRRPVANAYRKTMTEKLFALIRKKRWGCGSARCAVECRFGCDCTCAICAGTTCNGATCGTSHFCPVTTTTLETPGTIPTTTSYPIQNVIDECGSICYPNDVPNGISLTNCTLSFVGLVANTWYAVAIQVEDFINQTSTIPMSSVPVQFLIYIMPQPICLTSPVIIALTGCLEVTAGVSTSFNVSAVNFCDPSIAVITGIVVSKGVTGMQVGNLTNATTNASLSYVTFTWTPQINQIGPQELCTVAYTSEKVQSTQYCVTLTVITSSAPCTTTTTTSTTTSVTTTTTSSISSTTETTTMSVASASPQSDDNLSLELGLGLGLGLLLLLLLGVLATCLCCKWCPGDFWKHLRQRFWGEDNDLCELCGQRCVYNAHINNIKVSDDGSGLYQRQYIRRNTSSPTRPSFRDDSFLSDSLSPFDIPSMTTTRTTLMSSFRDNVMPSENASMRTTRPVRPAGLNPGVSILVRAYVEQEGIGDIFAFD